MLGQHLGVRPMVPPETLEEDLGPLKTPQNAVENEVSMARETVSAADSTDPRGLTLVLTHFKPNHPMLGPEA